MKLNKELWRTIKYILFTASAGVIQFVSTLVLDLVVLDKVIPQGETIMFITEADKAYFIANTVGLALSIIWNFTFNRKYTFKAASNVPLSMALAFVFYLPFYPFQIWYTDAVKGALIGSVGEALADIIATATVMIINFVLEFIWQRFVVFRKTIDTNDVAQKSAKQDVTDGDVSAAGKTQSGAVVESENNVAEKSSVGEEVVNSDEAKGATSDVLEG